MLCGRRNGTTFLSTRSNNWFLSSRIHREPLYRWQSSPSYLYFPLSYLGSRSFIYTHSYICLNALEILIIIYYGVFVDESPESLIHVFSLPEIVAKSYSSTVHCCITANINHIVLHLLYYCVYTKHWATYWWWIYCIKKNYK